MRVNTRSGDAGATLGAPPWWIAVLYLLLALIAQMELLHFVTFRGAQASAVLIVVVWYALRADTLPAAVLGLVAGLCEDVFSAGTGVAWTASSALTAIFVTWLSRWFFADSVPILAGVVIVATLLRRMLFWVVMALQGYPPGYARIHLHQALWEALLNALLVSVLLLLARLRESRSS
ncbi:MAG TPA: rod shape-determining protein MreD [Candidatus Baltobacteraceae bacterium]|nr:rod shape-determining protein MreD [Candidatus Baltobacteraceae bacterium]